MFKNRTGETCQATNGQSMTIIVYRSCRDIDVQFEDGTIVQHRQYIEFQKGWIKNPNISEKSHIGETGIAKNGQKMTIIAWRAYADIDIKFEDGTEVYHKTYNWFCKGYIKNPNSDYGNHIQRTINAKNRHIGEIQTAKNGLKMTLIEYRSSEDIDIEFEDGVIVTHKDYSSFVHGGIGHPNIDLRRSCQNIKDKTGESILAINGLNATIAEYQNSRTMRVKFETGYTTNNIQYVQFQRRCIRHPFPYEIGHISIDKPAYIYQDTGFFFCHCIKTNRVGIMSVDEIKACPCQTLQIEKRTKETQAIEE